MRRRPGFHPAAWLLAPLLGAVGYGGIRVYRAYGVLGLGLIGFRV